MFRFFVFLACVAFAALASAKYQTDDIKVFDNIEDFQAENPDIKLSQMDESEIPALNTLRYTYGNRTTGDKVVAEESNDLNYPNRRDVRVIFNYPKGGGREPLLTYVEINVNQTSSISRAHVLNGGIGRGQMSVLLDAKNTLRFSYRATFFALH